MVSRQLAVMLVLPFLALSCEEEETTAPIVDAEAAGRYTLAWFTQRDAAAIPGIPGLTFVVGDCGNGPETPNASFIFTDSTALVLQDSPQAYVLTLIGRTSDCQNIQTQYFDVAAGDYVLVDDHWLTLESDLHHPHLDGTLEVAGDTVEIQLRPALPGLDYPLALVDRLAFVRIR